MVTGRFRGGLVFKAHKLLYHSTLGLRVINKKKRRDGGVVTGRVEVTDGEGARQGNMVQRRRQLLAE